MSEKPLSSKKLRRLLRKQEKAEKKNAIAAQSSMVKELHPKHLKGKEIGLWYKDKAEKKKANAAQLSMVKELEKPPKHLKGKELGIWYRDQARRQKLLKRSSESSEMETKKCKKEKKALMKQQRKEEAELLQKCYKINIDPTSQQLIQEYLNSVSSSPPSFLLPQHEYHKKIKRKYCQPRTETTSESANCDTVETLTPSLNVDDFLSKSKELYENFPINAGEEISVSHIQKFLEKGEISDQDLTQSSEPTVPVSSTDCSEKLNDMSDQDGGILDSMDKYKHLEDTTFKKNFMDILSQDIQSKLEKAVLYNMALKKNKRTDKDLLADLRVKENNPRYRSMQQARQKLPSFKMQREILQLINYNQVCLISGETGCGKTTQVAQFILDDAIMHENGSMCNILCTQPRRISAISVAHRVAAERAEQVGRDSVGYQIRLEKKIGRPKGSILFCTTGILLQYMQSDPALKRYSHIILDEIHERDIMCDFVLTILRDVVAKRSDLKIVLMSATLNAEQFSAYFYNCPAINIPGYTYPVEEFYLEDVLMATKFVFSKNAKKKSRDFEDDESFKNHIIPFALNLRKAKKFPDFVIEGLMNPDSEKVSSDLIVSLVQYICQHKGPGAILIFVPGWEDITATVKKLNDHTIFPPSKFLIIPLHSMLPTAEQQSVFDRPRFGVRKIVVATNIAETSITIDDIVFVIDGGKIKIKNYDVGNNISTLKPEFVSLANARQRRGRAGRVQSGFCYHLFSRAREQLLEDYPLPEMLRTRLEEVILNIKLLQLGKASPFLSKVLDPPNAKTVVVALELLRQLNALDENENLTPLGFHLAKLPLDPQIGKMLLMGVTMSCLDPILSIAATLSHKDPFYVPLGEEKLLKERKVELDDGHKSDHLIMAKVLDIFEGSNRKKVNEFCDRFFLVRGTLYSLRDLKCQFSQYLCEMGFLKDTDFKKKSLNENSDNKALVKAVICSGLYPNVAIIKRKINTKGRSLIFLRTSEDGNVTLHQKSVNTAQQQDFESNFFVYHEKLRSSCIFIFETTMVSPLPLLFFCYDFFLTESGDKVIIQINKDLRFSCERKTAYLIEELKLRLDWLLEYKLSHPGQVSWTDNTADIKLLRTLTDLFSTETIGSMGSSKSDSDE